jgi:hypothetical protein
MFFVAAQHLSPPKPACLGPHFQAADERRQFLVAQCGHCAIAVRRGESTALEAFGATPQARSVPEKNFQPVPLPVGEDEQMARERILLKLMLHRGGQSIERAAQIDRSGGDEHACGWRKA